VDFDYPFANLPSALVETLPPVFVLLSCVNLSVGGWTSGVAVRILEWPCPAVFVQEFLVAVYRPKGSRDHSRL
jgi:hypothetical protein